jgi:hypothetical protein
MKLIPLSQNYFAQVDDEDYDMLTAVEKLNKKALP